MRRGVLPLVLALVLCAPGAAAVEPGEILDDPALEARAREISKDLRCLVCQNQSIDDSDAPLARDLRILVRDRLTEGDADDEVIAFIAARYGDFVLLRPPFKPATYALWLGPAAILLAGALGVAAFLRRRRGASPASAPPLNAEESRRLSKLMDGNRQP